MDLPQHHPLDQALQLLQTRRSAKTMTEPAPSPAEIETLLAIAARVPDHGKLAPWRFIVFEGEARARFGRLLVEIRRDEALSEPRQAAEAARLTRAPLVVAVVSRIRRDVPIPEWEQILSAGAVCQNLLLGAHALGYAGLWLTEWYAYDRRVLTALGLTDDERIAGFVHIGSGAPREDRPRPNLADIVTRY